MNAITQYQRHITGTVYTSCDCSRIVLATFSPRKQSQAYLIAADVCGRVADKMTLEASNSKRRSDIYM